VYLDVAQAHFATITHTRHGTHAGRGSHDTLGDSVSIVNRASALATHANILRLLQLLSVDAERGQFGRHVRHGRILHACI
jgi:hypothetical protein